MQKISFVTIYMCLYSLLWQGTGYYLVHIVTST